jgi:thiaminase (transcriptional activator TenA)
MPTAVLTLASALWQANQDLAIACLYHPFVQGIADGSLTQEIFVYYLGQDIFFLDAFARAYSIAAAKAPDQKGFKAFHQLASGVLGELQLHRSSAPHWGIDFGRIEPATATCRYTDFLQSTAWASDTGLIAATIAPCLRLYGYLGQELAKSGIPDHLYGDWIRSYSSPEYQTLVDTLEALTNQYATDTPDTFRTYREAISCEQNFFESAWRVEHN